MTLLCGALGLDGVGGYSGRMGYLRLHHGSPDVEMVTIHRERHGQIEMAA